VADWLLILDSYLPSHEAVVLVVSALPFVEARASIPLAASVFHFDWFKTAYLAWLGNTVPLFLVWLIVPPILHRSYEKFPRMHGLLTRRIHKLEIKYGESYKRYGALLLCLFVGIPLPGSGVWTASLLAVALEIPWEYAAPAILVGLILSIAVVELAVYGVISLFV